MVRMVLLYIVLLLVVLDALLVLSVSYDVHRLQVLEGTALARVGGAVEGGRLQLQLVRKNSQNPQQSFYLATA